MMVTTFFYVFMPETKGKKTLEEMETLFESHVSNRGRQVEVV